MGGKSGISEGGIRTRFGWAIWRRGHLEEMVVDGRIILK